MIRAHKPRNTGRPIRGGRLLRLAAVAAAFAWSGAIGADAARAQSPAVGGGYQQGQVVPVVARDSFGSEEIVSTGHAFFGQISGSLASLVERVFSRYGEPNGYILGEEGSGALIGGLRYGEGILYTRAYGERRVFWQGPSVGWDVGGDGAKVMMLVYDLPGPDGLYRRFGGVNGSAYLVGGLGFTVLSADTTTVVPVRAGLGARLGVALGYLKFTPAPTWNPF